MGSIRPLFTITVLVVVGAYLYVKINEGPARPHAGAHGNVDGAQDGVPPLAAGGGGATLAQDTSAPAWPPATTSPARVAPNSAAAATAGTANPSTTADSNTTKNALPEVPPIPELPELPQASDVALSTPPAVAPPIELPKNVPAARYGDDAGPNLGSGAIADASNALPDLPALPTVGADNTPPPVAPSAASQALPIASATAPPAAPNTATNAAPQAPPANDRYGTSATQHAMPSAVTAPTTPTNLPAAAPNDLRSPAFNAPSNAAGDDRYGLGASSPMPAAATAPPTSTAPPATNTFPAATTPVATQRGVSNGASFAASWPAIQTALDNRDLKQAHQLLSKWYGDESLSPAEAQKVESLLGQLAGTVIYSNEHQLEPARVVRPGETLESIANEYNVPWQLLAKINSISAPGQVRPGQELKVVRGPFSATIDLHRNELALEVGGYYAGTFAIAVPPGMPATDGQWLVEQKLGGDNASPPLASAPPAAPYRTIILRSAITGATTGKLMIDGSAIPRASQPGTIRVALQDAEDLSDILSIGSRVIVRR